MSGVLWTCVLVAATELLNPQPAASPAPLRIVSLAPAATEMVFALGAGSRVVGVTRYDTFPAEVARLPRVGGLSDPDDEAVIALHPELVIVLPIAREHARVLARSGTTALVASGETLEDMWDLLSTLGRVLQRPSEARALTEKLRQDFAQLRADAARRRPKPVRTLLVLGRNPWVAAGPGSFLDSLLPMVGAGNALTRGGHYPVLDAEAVWAAHPDVVVNLTKHPLAVPDVAGRHVREVAFDDEALLLPGPRLPEALRRLGTALDPVAP